MVPELPENRALVAAWDAALARNEDAILEASAAHRQRYADRDIDTLDASGWPLRPLFLPAALLEGLARGLVHRFAQTRDALLERIDDPDALFEAVPWKRELFTAIDFEAGLRDPVFLSSMRPDGFLYPDRFVLSEPNFGNGSFISNAYTEILYEWFSSDPVRSLVDWNPQTDLRRPFQALIGLIRSHLSPDTAAPFILLFAHHWEQGVIMSWEKRVWDQLRLGQQILEESGIQNAVAHEEEIDVDDDGVVRFLPQGRPVDAVVQFSIGTSLLDEPDRLTGDLAFLRGVRVGRAPYIKPLASLCMEKGILPFMNTLPQRASADELFVDVPTTEFPISERAVEYRTGRERWVLKRAFDGKESIIGVATPGRRWNRAVEAALDSKEYVAQHYRPLPRTRMPIARNNRIEWVDVRVELSPFLIGGQYAGAIARYAPDADGLIMSPPPPGMGLTLVCSTP